MNMNCNDYKALWHVWTEGGLSSELSGEFAAHRESCRECARWGLEMGRLEELLLEAGEEAYEAPAFLKTRIMARLDEAAPTLASRLREIFSLRRLAYAAMVGAAFVTGIATKSVITVEGQRPQEVAASRITLEFDAPDAEKVGLIGDFNEWGKKELPIEAKRADGKWIFELRLAPGRYQYAFEVNGKKWLPDPRAKGIIPDGFGGINSVLYIPAKTDLGVN